MCSITAAAIATTAISTGVGMFGQYQQAQSQEKAATAAANYNMQVAENDRAVQEGLARNERAKGIADIERQQRNAARAMGEMRANMGANGFELDSGTNLSLLAESAGEHQYDSAVMASNTNQAVWQRQTGALAAQNQGALAQWQKDSAGSGRNAALIGMGGTLLGGIGKGIGIIGDMGGGAGGGGIAGPGGNFMAMDKPFTNFDKSLKNFGKR